MRAGAAGKEQNACAGVEGNAFEQAHGDTHGSTCGALGTLVGVHRERIAREPLKQRLQRNLDGLHWQEEAAKGGRGCMRVLRVLDQAEHVLHLREGVLLAALKDVRLLDEREAELVHADKRPKGDQADQCVRRDQA